MSVPRFVSDWRQSWRWFSMRAMAVALALQTTWLQLPDDLRASVPVWLPPGLTSVLLVLGMLGRLMPQPELEAPKGDA